MTGKADGMGGARPADGARHPATGTIPDVAPSFGPAMDDASVAAALAVRRAVAASPTEIEGSARRFIHAWHMAQVRRVLRW